MIRGPKNAVPTLRGWVSPKGEMLKLRKTSQAEIDEWYGAQKPKAAPKPEPVVVQPEPEVLVQEELEAAPEPAPVAPKVSGINVPKAGVVRRAIKNTFKR